MPKIMSLRIFWALLIVAINAFNIFDNARLYYKYHFTDILFLFMYPDWILFLSSGLSLIAILLSVRAILRTRAIHSSNILDDFEGHISDQFQITIITAAIFTVFALFGPTIINMF